MSNMAMGQYELLVVATYQHAEGDGEESEGPFKDELVQDDAEDGSGHADHDQVADRHQWDGGHAAEAGGGGEQPVQQHQQPLPHTPRPPADTSRCKYARLATAAPHTAYSDLQAA